MAWNTRKYTARQKALHAEEKRRKERLERACKSLKVVPFGLTPAQEIAVLEEYLDNLRVLEKETKLDYDETESREALRDIRWEITSTIEQIVKLKIRNIKPD
jgi:hypothetical protein